MPFKKLLGTQGLKGTFSAQSGLRGDTFCGALGGQSSGDELLPAAQLGFAAGFLRSWSGSQVPPLSPCSHPSRQRWPRDRLSDGLPAQSWCPSGRRRERLLRGAPLLGREQRLAPPRLPEQPAEPWSPPQGPEGQKALWGPP